MSLVFGWILIGVLFALMMVEFLRYRRAFSDPEEVPYPRLRLHRRFSIGAAFIVSILIAVYFPEHARLWLRIALLLVIAGAMIFGFRQLFRDLSETSRAVVDHARNLDRSAGSELRQFFKPDAESNSDKE